MANAMPRRMKLVARAAPCLLVLRPICYSFPSGLVCLKL